MPCDEPVTSARRPVRSNSPRRPRRWRGIGGGHPDQPGNRVRPPSTRSTWPLMNLGLRTGEERHRVGDLLRLGVADQRIVRCPSSPGSIVRVAWKRAVLVGPGLTALTRTPSAASPRRGSGCSGRRRPSASSRSTSASSPHVRGGRGDVDRPQPMPASRIGRHEGLADQHRADQVVVGQRPGCPRGGCRARCSAPACRPWRRCRRRRS